MKIQIIPVTKEEKKNYKKDIIIENIYQFAITVNFIEKKIVPTDFRHSLIKDANQLIGQIETLKEDVKDHKKNNV